MIPGWPQPAEQFKYEINGLPYVSGSSQLISSVIKKPKLGEFIAAQPTRPQRPGRRPSFGTLRDDYR